MEADEHIVAAEVLEYELAHVRCRGPRTAVVDHAGGLRTVVLRATVADSEHTAKAVCEQQGRHER